MRASIGWWVERGQSYTSEVKPRITRLVFSSHFGAYPMLVLLLVTDRIVILITSHVLLAYRFPLDELVPSSIWVDYVLLVALGICYVCWLLLLVRGQVSAGTGTGFMICALAMSLRVLGAFPARYQQPFRLEASGVSAADVHVLSFARTSSFVFFVVGLAFVAAACISEWRLRRESPAWLGPGT